MPKLSLSEFADRVCDIMPVISKEFFKRQSEDFYNIKITLPQYVVLEIVHKYGEIKMTDIAHHMDISTAAITGIVGRLVRDGYVTRITDPRDRRIVKIRMMQKGSSMVKGALVQRKKMVAEIFGVISEKERNEYLKILVHIKDHLKNVEH